LQGFFLYLALLLFLLLSLFFSGSETAFMAVDRLRLKTRAESGDKTAEAIRQLISNPDRLLGVILLGSTLSSIGAATLVTYLVTRSAPKDKSELYSALASVLLTIVVLVFCELSPKIVAATHAELVLRRLFWMLRFAIWFLSPLARLATGFANLFVSMLGFSPKASPFAHALSEDEIQAIINGSESAAMPHDKRQMLSNVLKIGAMQVREVMIPRIEVTAVDIEDPLPDILAVIRKTSYSRIPVYRKNLDNLVGILYVKDLLQFLQNAADIDIEGLLRPVHYVPDSAPIESVFRQMQSVHLHMAVVVDEFGGVEGVVTLEDILEEIVGEIRDEHDTESEAVHEIAPDLYAIAGSLPVKDFNRRFKVHIPESRVYTTAAGFLQTLTGRLLTEGESVRYRGLTFSIDKVEGFRIVSMRVRTPGPRVPVKQVRSATSQPAQRHP
jgi:putative hemolysin